MKFQLDFEWKSEHRCRFKPEHKAVNAHTRVPAECKNHVKVHLHAECEDY